MIVFNSFPRSGNVFMSTLAGKLGIESSADHNYKLYYNPEINQCSYFRDPKECISSVVHRLIKSAKYPNWDNKSEIDIMIVRELDIYKRYAAAALENKDHMYIGDFVNIKKNPYEEIQKICKKFNLNFDEKRDYNKTEIEHTLYSNNLMTDHDGHMPRNKSLNRINLENYISSSDLFEEAYQIYREVI